MGKGGKSWISSQKSDMYYKKAKSLGFRSRAAFKFIQMNRKFDVYNINGRFPNKILDLGCAPGAWIQVILKDFNNLPQKRKPKHFKIYGIDLTTIKPFEPGEHVEFLRANLFKTKSDDFIQKNQPYNLILSDLAPKTSGDFRDIAIQEQMVEKVIEICEKYLTKNGNLITKIFQSESTTELKAKLEPIFNKTQLTKPKASRSSSREVYLVGLGKK
jgi:cell division protein FtsJ